MTFTEYHEWLLGDQVDLLPRLLLPLAGPEEFDDDDMERLPDDLQYLPSDKTREPEAHIRKMLTEAILQVNFKKNFLPWFQQPVYRKVTFFIKLLFST